MRSPISRRSFIRGTSAILLADRLSLAESGDRPLATPPTLATPYKLGTLVLDGSKQKRGFDEKSVDCPFVFRGDDRFYMTFVGYDGIGYQTGLASSDDLVHWQREGCILHRDPQSPITRYNIAMTWILRENDIAAPGKLVKVDGEYIGAWHAYPSAGYEAGPAVIGLCRSKDLLHWRVEEPILHPDDHDTGAWEQGGLYKPCIVRHAGTYYIYYNAKTKPVTTNGHVNWFEQTGGRYFDGSEKLEALSGESANCQWSARRMGFTLRERSLRPAVQESLGFLLFWPEHQGWQGP